MTTVRYRLAFELIKAYGLLDRADVDVLDAARRPPSSRSRASTRRPT